MIYGYARCSTNEHKQDIDRQKRELLKMGAERIFWEYESGTKKNRQELNELLDIVKGGDTIVTTEVSRLTRSTIHLCEILQTIQEKKICLKIGTFVADCRSDDIDPMTKGMLMMWGVFAEMERDIICQRVRSGMANAKAKGKKVGRPHSCLPKKFLNNYKEYVNGDLSVIEFAKRLNVSRQTIYRYIKEYQKACNISSSASS